MVQALKTNGASMYITKENGFVIPPRDPYAIAAAMQDIFLEKPGKQLPHPLKIRKACLLTMNTADLQNSKTTLVNQKSKCPLCNSHGIFSFESKDFLYKKSETYRYIQCTNCSAIYQDPMPTTAEISSFYPDDYSAYHEVSIPKRQGFTRLATLRYKYHYTHLNVPPPFMLLVPFISSFLYRNAIHFVPDGRGLDIGCGNGQFIINMNSLGWQFEGVEFNPLGVKVCRKAGLKVFHGELHAAKFEDNTFDLVSARHLIEHIPDPNRFINEIARILKKKGRLIIDTPNSEALGRNWFGTYWFANEVPRHLILFNPKNLTLLIERHGLRLVACRTHTSPTIILNSWDLLTKNRGKPSRKHSILRFLARLYGLLTTVTRKGDKIFAIYEKL